MNNKSPLVLPAIIWSLGILFAKFFHAQVKILFILFIFFLLLTFIKKIKLLCIVFMIFILGMLRWNLFIFLPKNHIYHIVNKNETLTFPIEGKIVSEVRKNRRTYFFTLKLYKIKNIPANGKIIMQTYQKDLEYGDIIRCNAQVKKLKPPNNPGNFDFRNYLFSKGIYAKGFSNSFINVVDYRPNFFINNIIKSKKFVRKRINERFYKYTNFTKAILIAEKDDLKDWKTLLTKSGLSHLLAVSGLHIAILTLIIFTILKIFILNRYILYSSVIFILFYYGFITNWPPSVLRAVTMIILYMIAKLIQRKPNPNNILAATLIIITAINPNQLFSPGFQMSFLAVLTLFNVHLNIKPSSGLKKIFMEILIVVIYSFLLNLFLAPITMYHFHSLNMNGVISNLFGIPMLGIILPLAILVTFLPAPLFIPFQYSYIFIMRIFEKLLSFTYELPFKYDFIKLTEIRFFLLISLILLYFLFKKFFKKLYVKVAFILILLMIVILPYKDNKDFLIILFNVDNSQVTYIETSDNDKILLTSGNLRENIFEKILIPYFKENGISGIDKLIITDFNIGKLTNLFKNIKINEIIIPMNTDIANTKSHIPKIITVKDSFIFNYPKSKLKLIKLPNKSDITEFSSIGFNALFLEKEDIPLSTNKLTLLRMSYKKNLTVDILKRYTPMIAFVDVSSRQARFFDSNPLENSKTNIFISAKDGALIIKSVNSKIQYRTMLSGKKGFIESFGKE